MRTRHTMKRKGFSPYQQTELRKEQKIENLKIITKITKDPTLDDLRMVYYACKKHGFFFWYDTKNKNGSCCLCKQEGITGLTKRHIKDSELSEQIHRTIEQMIDDRNEHKEFNMLVEESIKIDDGKYNGIIIDVNEKTEPYEYIHFVVDFKVEDRNVKLDFSCPSKITMDKKTDEPTSKLAKTLKDFDFEYKIGEDVTVEQIKEHFVNKKVSSLISNKKTPKGTFAQVMTMTIPSK